MPESSGLKSGATEADGGGGLLPVLDVDVAAAVVVLVAGLVVFVTSVVGLMVSGRAFASVLPRADFKMCFGEERNLRMDTSGVDEL